MYESIPHPSNKVKMSEEQYYQRAKKIVKKKKAFRANALSFAMTMPFLIFVNLWTSSSYLWFIWPLVFWGGSLIPQYFDAYVWSKRENWEDHEVQKEMERMRRRDSKNKSSKYDDFDEHLELREMREMRSGYDERDLV